jgi:radical SAM superfamily enzyme YgiQ (UPF0313 family)
MKIFLVRAPFIEIQTGAPIGLAFIQNTLKRLGHLVRVIDFSFDVSAKHKFTCGQFTRNFTIKNSHPAHKYAYTQLNRYCNGILKQKPNAVGFHLAYSTTDFSLAMAKRLAGKGIRLIAGGPDATYRAEELKKLGLFDAIVCGYGEEAVKEALVKPGVFSVHLHQKANYVPDYTGVEFRKYGNQVPILTTRGCPHSCTFCSQHLRYYYHNIGSVIKQIRAVPSKCNIMLNDSNLNVNPKRTKELFREIGKVIGKRRIHAFGFEINPRFDEFMGEYARCNFSEVRVGIESGSPKVRKEMNKPQFTNEMVRKNIKKMTACGTLVWAQFIFCYPTETDADREATLKLMHQISRENPKGRVKFFWFRFVVHHGTEKFFEEKHGVTTQTIRDWNSPSYTPAKVAALAKKLQSRLPPNAKIYL